MLQPVEKISEVSVLIVSLLEILLVTFHELIWGFLNAKIVVQITIVRRSNSFPNSEPLRRSYSNTNKWPI